MTLSKKFSIAVFLLLLAMFSATSFIVLNNDKNYLSRQLVSQTRNNATKLALALTPAFRKENMSALVSKVQELFSLGGFEQIDVRDNKNNLLISRKITQSQNPAPGWFIRMIGLPVVEQQAVVMNQQRQVAKVLLSGDRSMANAALWKNAVGLFLIFMIFTVSTLILGYVFIQSLLRPLKRLEQQALSIADHEFLIEDSIPKSPELKNLTVAMNQMIFKIKSLFDEQLEQTEKLRQQVYLDSLTDLSNRHYFIQQLQALLDNEDDFIPGYVIMLVIDGLDEYNQQHGYEQGDRLILSIASICKEYWQFSTTASVARPRGNTFAIIEHEQDATKLEQKAKEFEQRLVQFFTDIPSCQFHLAATPYFYHQTATKFLALLDAAVKKASENGAFYSHTVQDNIVYPRLLLSEDILIAMENKNISLYWQAITNTEQNLHHEVFVRMEIHSQDEIGAGYFIPVAEQYEIAHLIDLYVLMEVVKLMVHSNEDIAVNLSKDTVINPNFSELYLKQLRKMPKHLCHRLSVEINEAVLLDHLPEVQLFIKKVRKLGVQIGIDRVGTHFTTLHHFGDLPVNYVKLHGSLLQDIEDNEGKQFFIHYLMLMMKTLGIDVIATQIEYESQWKSLQLLNILWGQGRYLSPVEALEVPEDTMIDKK